MPSQEQYKVLPTEGGQGLALLITRQGLPALTCNTFRFNPITEPCLSVTELEEPFAWEPQAATGLGRSYSDQSLRAEQQSSRLCMASRDPEALVKCHKPGAWHFSCLAWQSTGSLSLEVSFCKMGYSANL